MLMRASTCAARTSASSPSHAAHHREANPHILGIRVEAPEMAGMGLDVY